MYDYISPHHLPEGNRFAVVYAGYVGPCVSFWPDVRTALDLMVRHANTGLRGFAVWERATPAARRWKCIAGGAE